MCDMAQQGMEISEYVFLALGVLKLIVAACILAVDLRGMQYGMALHVMTVCNPRTCANRNVPADTARKLQTSCNSSALFLSSTADLL